MPYLPWYNDDHDWYVSKQEIRDFLHELNETTGAATVDLIAEELLD